jgi:hypothetical protein
VDFIKDQRHMIAGYHPRTVADMEAVWQDYREADWRGTTDTGHTLTAYVSANRWVADCPNCAAGIAAWAQNPRGCCLGCGLIYTIAFPTGWLEAEKVLLDRAPRYRHWLPGETVDQLKAENIAKANLPGVLLGALNNPDLGGV